jgi:pimeloyl-ACP methyl ester carboxylesterase
MKKTIPLLLLLFTLINSAQAEHPLREAEVAEQLVKELIIGKPVWLESGGSKFLSIYTDNTDTRRRGAVIILHDLGAHPDWPEVISPLRKGLADRGWPTLSLQLPLHSKDTPLTEKTYLQIYDAAVPRLNAAVNHLNNNGIYNMALLGHGMGASVIAHYLAGQLPQNHAIYIKGFIGIQFRTLEELPAEYQPNHLLKQRSRFPILDLISSSEDEKEQQYAKLRRGAALQAKNQNYRQLEILGADKQFIGSERLLVKRVHSWLKRYAGGSEVDLIKKEK